MLWLGALIFALIDIIFVAILVRKLKLSVFRRLKWTLVVTTAIFWCLLWLILVSYMFWEPVYRYVFPGWARWLIPPVYGLFFGGVALLIWWLALRLPGHGVINFFILGGLWGMITHIWAVYRGILDKPPLLQGASPVAAVIMPIFEFVFYWCVILSITTLLQRAMKR